MLQEVVFIKKMIVTDLDGTLLNSSHKVSSLSKTYLSDLKEKGYVIVLATGRVLKSALGATDGALFADYIISDNGSVIYEVESGKIIFEVGIDKRDARKIIDFYDDSVNYIEICDYYAYNIYTDNYRTYTESSKKITDVLKYLENVKLISHMGVIMKNNLESKYEALKTNFSNLYFLIMQDSFSSNKWIDIFPKGVSKYQGITFLMEKEHISNDDVIAFGDGLNDVCMIENVGVGVAIGNALDDVKRVSKYVADSNDSDGVVKFLKQYL